MSSTSAPTCDPRSVVYPARGPMTKQEWDFADQCTYSQNNLDLMVKCDCMDQLNRESKAYDMYQYMQAKYQCDKRNSDYYQWELDKWNTAYNWAKEDLQNWRSDSTCIYNNRNCATVNPEWMNDRADGDCTRIIYNRGVEQGQIPGTRWICKYTPETIEQRMQDWVKSNPKPLEVPQPTPPAPFQPNTVQCCAQDFENIQNTSGSVDFEDIRQKCTARLTSNIITPPPYTPSPFTLPPYTQTPDTPSPYTLPPYTPSSYTLPPDSTTLPTSTTSIELTTTEKVMLGVCIVLAVFVIGWLVYKWWVGLTQSLVSDDVTNVGTDEE